MLVNTPYQLFQMTFESPDKQTTSDSGVRGQDANNDDKEEDPAQSSNSVPAMNQNDFDKNIP